MKVKQENSNKLSKITTSQSVCFRIILIGLFLNIACPDFLFSQTQDTLLAYYSVNKCDSLINANAKNPDFVILDLRTSPEYIPDHLAGAINMNYYAANISQLLNALPRHKMYLIYCLTGSRSGIVYNMMVGMNFTWVVNMYGGVNSWKSALFPTTSDFAPFLMAVSDTIVPNDTIAINTVDTIQLMITNRANDTLSFYSQSSLSGTEFSADFDTIITLEGSEDYSFSIYYTPVDEISDTLLFNIESNGGDVVFYIIRTGKLLVGIDDALVNNELNIYPNPATSSITISNNGKLLSPKELSIFNLGGLEIFRQELPELQESENIDVSFLRAGTYIVRIVDTNSFIATKKLLIVR